ncbi:hypothetical protein BKA58DRAFT_376426 [Alternaria rosae]|uniref:uncharacterized protein n=1 Tax=Alternaria rosae TaxID=1187941 RepID=UPI001E8CCFD3|nr:uncharacterized protein BKA58DRAFT_376426 [Alternaria rosae]KAH6878054.1 hypothetical protein BKA58DRAFT_376426 [Alternaria rosae]
MTAPLRNTQHASAIAAITASQNSAPVAEFRCLYTQDVKRKQKRWQDGYLKFHTFNSRVMVYDQARNFLGDTYHKDSNELQEGDELSLNNGALVEVAEAMGITHTDLTQLLEKKTKEQPPRPTAPSQPKPFQRPSSVAPTNAQLNASQLRHKSLNTLLGTPKGPLGKAQPMRSPYEARKEKENELVEEPTPKRQKTSQPRTNWRASSPVQEDSPIAKRDKAVHTEPSDAANARKPSKFIPPTVTVITIESESDPVPAYLSDVTLPSTPPKLARARARSSALHTPAPQPAIPQQPLAQTPKIPKGKVPVPSVQALETPKQRAPPSSPPVSASNRLTNVDFALQPTKQPPKDPTPPPPSPPPNRKTKSLRLSAGVKRGTLLCQSLPQKTIRAGSEARATSSNVRARQVSRLTSKEPSPAVSQKSAPPQELASAASKRVAKSKRRNIEAQDGVGLAPKRARVSKSPPLPSPSVLEDPEIIHGFMDQQLIIPSSPPQPQAVSPPPEAVSKPKSTTTKQLANKTAAEPPPKRHPTESKSPPPKETIREAQPRNNVVDQPASVRKAPSPLVPALDPPISASRDVSPAHNEASETQSRTSSTSPRKAPLSTGGFPKRPAKRLEKQSVASPLVQEEPAPAPASRNESAPLPPHPLRANKKGPMMSTTELASLLQKPQNLAKALADPIEDGSNMTSAGKSPSRNFRRVRSENDAPIPSTADDWEKRNLPKTSSNLTDSLDDPNATTVAEEPKKKKSSGLDALIKRTDPRRKFKRTQSLQVETNVPTAAMGEVELPSPVVDKDVGPWSTEASDLFDWRPPGRD